MSRSRFNIASMLVVVVLVLGVGFAALRESNETWDSALFTLALCVLLASILLAVYRNEARRAFWLGVALFGSGYLALTLVPSIESRLATTKAPTSLDSNVPVRAQTLITAPVPANQVRAFAFSPQRNQLATSGLGAVRLWDVTTGRVVGGWGGITENFVRIGHSLFAVMVGCLGGLLSRHFHARHRETLSGLVPQ
jgi:hypothetical protein